MAGTTWIIERQGVVESMTASTDGSHWLAGAKAGYLMPLGIDAVRAGNRARLCQGEDRRLYRNRRSGAEPQRQFGVGKVADRRVGAELRGDFDTGGVSVRPYLSAMVEKQLLDGDRTVRFAQTSSPGIVNSWTLGDQSKKAYGRISGGGSAEILKPGDDERGPVDHGRPQGRE